jgi:hypothetical protein
MVVCTYPNINLNILLWFSSHRKPVNLIVLNWAAIQRRGSILAWTVILSVYGADTIEIDISLSALIS